MGKAIPHAYVQEEARQQLAVMRYLEQLSDTQVALSALTLETEPLAIASGVSSCKERLRSLVDRPRTPQQTFTPRVC